FPDKKQSLIEFLKTVSECNDKQVSISIKDIQAYSELDKYIHPERVKQAFNMDENTEINLETIYNKLSEIIDIVAEYFTGNENNRKINSFIDNLIQVEIPEDFIQKLYKNYVKEEDKKYFSVDLFKVEVIRQIENNILKNILPHVFNPSIDYNKFATNVAKTYLVETLLSQMYVFNLDSTKNYVLHSIQTADSKHREQLLEKYYSRDSVFTYTENVSQDVKVSFQLENINQIHFADFIGMKEDDFK
ncbi:MAG: hypothetical protein N2203_03755, partial [Bacteroidia bacterium]|nr:hypothetical protein [Bacteroidia bacterium]